MSTGRLAVAAALLIAALIVSALLGRRRRTAAPSQPTGRVPSQLDRADFADPDRPWLVAVFSSASCHTCADVVAKATALASRQVAVHEVEFTAARELHRRYGIDAVPTLVVCDGAGVVRKAFQGPVTATDLWAAVAEAREPGTTPEPTLGG